MTDLLDMVMAELVGNSTLTINISRNQQGRWFIEIPDVCSIFPGTLAEGISWVIATHSKHGKPHG